jgi:hypothetical protein
MATTKPPGPPPVTTPFFEKDKASMPPLVPCKAWIDWMTDSVFAQLQAIFILIEAIQEQINMLLTPDNESSVGTLSAVANTVVHTVALTRTTRITATFVNTGASDRLVYMTVTKGATTAYVLSGNATNSPSLAGTGPGVDVQMRLNVGDTIQAWQDSGADVDFTVNCEGVE